MESSSTFNELRSSTSVSARQDGPIKPVEPDHAGAVVSELNFDEDEEEVEGETEFGDLMKLPNKYGLNSSNMYYHSNKKVGIKITLYCSIIIFRFTRK